MLERTAPDTSADAPWKVRFRASSVLWSDVAVGDPSRGVVCSNRDGPFQMYAWDVVTGELRVLSDRAGGLAFGTLSPDGRWFIYLDDLGGSEVGHHVRVPWSGGPAVDLVPNLAPYASFSQSASLNGRVFVTLTGDEAGYHLVCADLEAAVPTGRVVWSTQHLAFDAVAISDGSIAVVPVASHSKEPRFDLWAIELAGGEVVGQLWDGEGTSIEASMASPIPGDARVVAISDRAGIARPLLWDARSGERRDLVLADAEGEVVVQAWSPDGTRLALKESWRGENKLWIYDLDKDEVTLLPEARGSFATASFGPKGELLVSRESSTELGHVAELDARTGATVRVAVPAGAAPPCTPMRSVSFPAADGDLLQAWVAVPPGEGPFPTIIETHGGPQAVATDAFVPQAQMWTDHGYAYVSLNYRGSTGFGRGYMEKIWGHPGDLEVDDLVSTRDRLVTQGVADPEAILLTGWSYGGYLTLQGLGRRPDLWAGGMAGVAVADWTLMHEDSNDVLRGYLEGILGGPPDANPDTYRTASPITYVDQLAAPLLIVQGRNDSRCPSRQVEVYVEKALEAGKRVEIDWFDSGHAAWTDIEESVRQFQLMLEFADRVLSESRV